MKKQYVLATIFLLNTAVCVATDFYQSDITFLTPAERQAQIEILASTETLSERQYLTQMALEKTDVFIRQLNRARLVVQQGGETGQVSRLLRAEGFFSPEVQSILTQFISLSQSDNTLDESRVIQFLVSLNNEIDTWSYLFNPEVSLDDYAALECASGKLPENLLGSPEHQYLLQVANPNMELSLWRFDAAEAITYPVATLIKTTVDEYGFVDRFGQQFGVLNRNNLSMTDANGEILQCQKIDPLIMRAYQDHRREMILSEKQL